MRSVSLATASRRDRGIRGARAEVPGSKANIGWGGAEWANGGRGRASMPGGGVGWASRQYGAGGFYGARGLIVEFAVARNTQALSADEDL